MNSVEAVKAKLAHLATLAKTQPKSKFVMPHSADISVGHTNHKQIMSDGIYSWGTHVADHPSYPFGVRIKPDTTASRLEEDARATHYRDVGSAQRELAVHDLYHKHMGLGAHMHHVGITKQSPWKSHHGEANYGEDQYSVHQNLGDHKTLSNMDADHGQAASDRMLKPHHDSGDVHKLATADYIIGNSDRHGGNVMLHEASSPKTVRPLQMIDHGLTLPDSWEVDDVHPPSYWHVYGKNSPAHGPAHSQQPKVHAWLKGINIHGITQHLKSAGFCHEAIKGVHDRYNEAVNAFANHKCANLALKSLWQMK